jgi:NAD(P)-dependent dehydrogenase (short-subunit alcohol dehydrogenase family)
MSVLEGTRVLVAGGTRGPGAAIARHFALAGARVVVAARRAVLGRPGTFVRADLATADGAQHLAKTALEILGGIDVVVDSAGGQRTVSGGLPATTDDDWTAGLSAGLLAAVRLDRELLPAMIAQGSGVIVHMGSGAAPPPWSAAKAALATYSRALAAEVAPHGVRVVTVPPGTSPGDVADLTVTPR